MGKQNTPTAPAFNVVAEGFLELPYPTAAWQTAPTDQVAHGLDYVPTIMGFDNFDPNEPTGEYRRAPLHVFQNNTSEVWQIWADETYIYGQYIGGSYSPSSVPNRRYVKFYLFERPALSRVI